MNTRLVFVGGDVVDDKTYPGLALYHEGFNLVAIVSTGDDVWQLKVKGQLANESWSNIGVRWEPFNSTSTKPMDEQGGLEVKKTTTFTSSAEQASEMTGDVAQWLKTLHATKEDTTRKITP